MAFENGLGAIGLAGALLLGGSVRLLALGRINSDQWGVRGKIERQRPHRWVSYAMPDSVVPGIRPYPFLVHFLASRLPPSWSSLAAFAMTVVPDLVLAAGVYGAVTWGLARQGLGSAGATDLAALGATLVFLSLPGLVPGNARTGATNGRALGLLWCTGCLVCVGLAATGAGDAWLLAASLLAALATLTSYFAMQTLFLFAGPLALLTWDVRPLVPPAAVVTAACLLPRLGLREVLLGKINHFIWYARNPEGTVVERRNLLRNALELPGALWRDPERARALLLTDAPLWIAAWSFPPLGWLCAWGLSGGLPGGGPLAPEVRFGLAWVAASALCFVATSTGRGTILGEAERYFEYASPALCVLLAWVGVGRGWLAPPDLLGMALLQGSLVAAAYLVMDRTFVPRLRFGLAPSREVDELVEFLRGLPGSPRVGTLPIKLSDLLFVHTSTGTHPRIRYYHRFVMRPGAGLDGYRDYERDAEELQVFRGPPERIARRYGLDTLVADRRYLATKADTDFAKGLAQRVPVFENAKYAVYRP